MQGPVAVTNIISIKVLSQHNLETNLRDGNLFRVETVCYREIVAILNLTSAVSFTDPGGRTV
jgi:hypothetical protein